MGWLMNISRAFVHRYLISYSCSWTGFPGLFPRTDNISQQLMSWQLRHAVARTLEQPVDDRVEVDFRGAVGHVGAG